MLKFSVCVLGGGFNDLNISKTFLGKRSNLTSRFLLLETTKPMLYHKVNAMMFGSGVVQTCHDV